MKSDKKFQTDQLIDQNSVNDFFAEIETRYNTFFLRCDIDPKQLGEYEILNLHKREDNFNLELREFIDKVTAVSQFVFPCRDEAKTLSEQTQKMCDMC